MKIIGAGNQPVACVCVWGGGTYFELNDMGTILWEVLLLKRHSF